MTKAAFNIKIRMYRQGLGDCFLVTLPRKTGGNYYVMIDCGVVLGTEGASAAMQQVLQSIREETKVIDLLIITHEHWDHVSGIVQAPQEFDALTFKEVWLGWTENKNDPVARKLGGERAALREGLRVAAMRMQLAGMEESMQEVLDLTGLFGAAGKTTQDALNVVKGLPAKLRYCKPSDAPFQPDGIDARFYVLGPPLDEKLLKRYDPRQGETYGVDAIDCYLSGTVPALTAPDPVAPFDTIYQIPVAAARQMPFFRSSYWGELHGADGTAIDQSWRTIDDAWLENSATLALMLDNATNNTSLVIAIDLGDEGVYLFTGDAQVGSWLSWQDLKWTVDGKEVTGPDILRRTRFYKAGHHGSHNATLREKGLEMMENLQVSMIPVDHDMAVKKHWNNMPLPMLVERLKEKTGGNIIRTDQQFAGSLEAKEEKLYYEVAL